MPREAAAAAAAAEAAAATAAADARMRKANAELSDAAQHVRAAQVACGLGEYQVGASGRLPAWASSHQHDSSRDREQCVWSSHRLGRACVSPILAMVVGGRERDVQMCVFGCLLDRLEAGAVGSPCEVQLVVHVIAVGADENTSANAT